MVSTGNDQINFSVHIETRRSLAIELATAVSNEYEAATAGAVPKAAEDCSLEAPAGT